MYDRIARSGTGGRNTYVTKEKITGKIASSEIWRLKKYMIIQEYRKKV
jgi:hypothetical protein